MDFFPVPGAEQGLAPMYLYGQLLTFLLPSLSRKLAMSSSLPVSLASSQTGGELARLPGLISPMTSSPGLPMCEDCGAARAPKPLFNRGYP